MTPDRVATGSTSVTLVFDAQGQRVFPCHCGKTHEGDYGLYDWAYHNCLHESPLVHVDGQQFLCPHCGQSFEVVTS